MLDRYQPGARISFVRNPNCFYPKLPYADAVELTINPDSNAALAAFLAGKFDFGPEPGMTIRRSDVAAAKNKPGHRWRPLQTREVLLPSGGIAASTLAQDARKGG